MTRPLTQMLAELDTRVQSAYEDSAHAARADPQQAGHVAEAAWKRVLEEWLPPGYGVGVRKYITPETNEDEFETDLVVFRPVVPEVVRAQTRIPHGAVAAAFSVRRSADRDGVKDATSRAARLRRSMDRSNLHSDQERIHPAYPVGFLAMGHRWSGSKAAVSERVLDTILDIDHALAEQPSESLDLVCVANVGTWSLKRVPEVPVATVRLYSGDEGASRGCPMTFWLDPASGQDRDPPANPVGLLIRELYGAMEAHDRALSEFAYSLRKDVAWPSGSGPLRLWR